MVKRLRDRRKDQMPDSGTSYALDDTAPGIEALRRIGVVPTVVGEVGEGNEETHSPDLVVEEAFYMGSPRVVVAEVGAYDVKVVLDKKADFHDAPIEDLSRSSLESRFHFEIRAGVPLDVAQAEATERELGHKVYAEYEKLALLYELNVEKAYGILGELDEPGAGILTNEQRDAIAQVYAAVATHFSQDLDLIHVIDYNNFLEIMGVGDSSFAIVQNIDLSKVAMEYAIDGEFVGFLDVLGQKAEEIFEIDYVSQDGVPDGFQIDYDSNVILAEASDDVVALDGGEFYLSLVGQQLDN